MPHLIESQEFLDMFLDEARLAARLDHPNICQIFELGELSGTYFIAMEYIAGVDLKDLQEEIVPILEEMSQREGYMLVLNKMQSGIVFAHDSIDITDKLIEEFDAKAKPDAAVGDSTR